MHRRNRRMGADREGQRWEGRQEEQRRGNQRGRRRSGGEGTGIIGVAELYREPRRPQLRTGQEKREAGREGEGEARRGGGRRVSG